MELSKKSDLYLIRKVKKSADNDAYLELKKRYEKLYYSTAASYCKKVEKLDYSSLVEDIDLVLLKSINTFNFKKKCKISSYFCNMSRFHVLNTIKSNSDISHFIPTENKDIDFLNGLSYNIHIDKNEDTKNHVFSILNKLNDSRIIKIFEMRYYSDKENSKWRAIAGKLNLSIQQCSNLFSKGREFLYKNMVKE